MAKKRSKMRSLDLLSQLRFEISDKLCEIEEICNSYSLPLTRFSLLARDPSNDEMGILLTNEPDADLSRMAEVMMKRIRGSKV